MEHALQFIRDSHGDMSQMKACTSSKEDVDTSYIIRRSSPSICKVLKIKPTVPNYFIFFPLHTIS